MSFFRFIIGVPLIIAVAVVAFMNNEMVSINLWPFPIDIKALLSVVIIVMFAFGYIYGRVDSWMAYSPLRTALRSQRRQNKRLNAAQQKLTEQVEGLQEDLESMKNSESGAQGDAPKVSFVDGLKGKMASLFDKRKPKKEEDFWCL